MERFNSILYFVILYSILILALEVSITESAIIHKQKRSYKVCRNTIPTLNKNVTKCPGTRKEQLERSQKKSCNMLCDGRPCVYHCVKYEDRIVEVCAPVEKLIGHHCPIYDEGIGRVREDVLTVCTKCPFEYYTNDTQNSECMISTVSISEINKEKKTDVITNQNSAVANCTQVGGRSKRNAGCKESSPTTTESSSKPSTRTFKDDKLLSGSQEDINSFWNHYVIYVVGVVLFICMVLFSVGMVLHMRRKKAPNKITAQQTEVYGQIYSDGNTFRKTQTEAEGQFICQKKCNPGVASSQSLLKIEGVH